MKILSGHFVRPALWFDRLTNCEVEGLTSAKLSAGSASPETGLSGGIKRLFPGR
jgi:hypothetical protein